MQIIVISWILGFGIIGTNVYYLITDFLDWLLHNSLPKLGNVFIGIIVFPLMAFYVASVIYLTFRKDAIETYIEPTMDNPISQTHMKNGIENPNGPQMLAHIPY